MVSLLFCEAPAERLFDAVPDELRLLVLLAVPVRLVAVFVAVLLGISKWFLIKKLIRLEV
jgi:hypothetical protein